MLAVSALALTGIILTGCSGSSNPDSPGSSAGGAHSDQLVVALSGDIDNFDPHTNQQIIYEYSIRSLVFSTLVTYDAELKLQPDLAQYDVNDDASVFTFTLTGDEKFQDGTVVDAAAVVASLERAASAANSIWSGRLADVKSYETPDDKTVVITLNSPNAAFLAGLASIAIVAPSGAADEAKKPVGSGPYSFVSWTPNNEIVLERFDDYFGTKGATEKIVLKPIADQQVALNNLYSGDVDIISKISAATKSQIDAARATVVEPTSTNSMSLIEFNSSGKLADIKVRQALAYALDKDAVRKIAYGDAGDSTWSPLPKSSWAYAEQKGYPFDLDKAKKLIGEAGAEGLTFELNIPSGNPDAEAIARVWQESLAKIGVTLKPNVTELSVWLDAYVSRSYDATWNVFNVGADPNSYFDIIMQPHLGDDYKNAEVSQLIADAVATPDESARAKTYGELQKILVDELPVMTVQSVPAYSAVAPGVEGYVVNPLGWALLVGASVSK